MITGSLALAAALLPGVSRRVTAFPALLLVGALLAGWAYTDVGPDWHLWIWLLHLSAFTLWLGGALWNIEVAMPAWRRHPNVDAVLAGAKQLDRFR